MLLVTYTFVLKSIKETMKRDVNWNVDIEKYVNTNMRGNLQFYATIPHS